MFRLSFFVTVLFFLILTTILYASENKYQLGVQGGVTTLSGGESPKYTFQRSVGFDFGYWFKERWSLNFNLSRHKNFNDTSATSSLSFGADELNATRKWQATRLGLTVNHLLFEADNQWNLSLAWGGGLMIWKILDPIGDTVINVSGIHNETVDYATSEIFFTGISSIHISLNQKWSVDWSFQTDYLTGAGAEFASSVKSLRDKWQLSSFISLNLHFGKVGSKIKWKSENTWSPQTSRQNFKSLDPNDNDGDGITDDNDKCQNTPVGVKVDKYGCSFDTDGDGVSDAHDDCPGTDRLAVGMIDVNGCPVDSDFDGIPDYADQCPFNQVGAFVDDKGCPVDTDGDGVPDGLDDCPYTLFGVDVDRFGCIDLTILSKPMVLNIDYIPGSFEIDPANRERVKELARILSFVPVIKLDIYGYTDNIGTAVANKNLSYKRARRVRDYLVSLDINSDRIKTFGKGETNFVAANKTAAGRAKNRRIEIVFYK